MNPSAAPSTSKCERDTVYLDDVERHTDSNRIAAMPQLSTQGRTLEFMDISHIPASYRP